MLGQPDTDGAERDKHAGLRRFAIFAMDDSTAVCMGVGVTFGERMAVDLKDEPQAPVVYESESRLRAAIEQLTNFESEPRVWVSFEDSLGLECPADQYNGIELSGP